MWNWPAACPKPLSTPLHLGLGLPKATLPAAAESKRPLIVRCRCCCCKRFANLDGCTLLLHLQELCQALNAKFFSFLLRAGIEIWFCRGADRSLKPPPCSSCSWSAFQLRIWSRGAIGAKYNKGTNITKIIYIFNEIREQNISIRLNL